MKATDVTCPMCNVAAGQRCRNLKSGAPLVGVHGERAAAAAAASSAALHELGTASKPTKAARYGIERVTQFKAADGTLHDTFNAAVKHTNDAELARWLNEWWRDNSEHGELTGSIEQLAAYLKKDWIISRRPKWPK